LVPQAEAGLHLTLHLTSEFGATAVRTVTFAFVLLALVARHAVSFPGAHLVKPIPSGTNAGSVLNSVVLPTTHARRTHWAQLSALPVYLPAHPAVQLQNPVLPSQSP
jgi:hypothetical protein